MLTEIAGEDTVLKIECFLKKVKKVYWDNRNRKMTETTTLSPLVSIIVPVYNVERYIKRCVDSLRRQTLQNIEIILVDDGSKDNSGCLCDELAQQDAKIHVIHKQNAGQGLARNDGLNIAKGRYVLFIDSDDFIEPDTCEKLSDRMEREQADLCSFGYQIETPQGELFYRAQLKEQCYENEAIQKRFVLHFFGDSADDEEMRGVSACMTMFRRSVIETGKIRFRSEREYFSEDTIFNLDFCLLAKKAVIDSGCYYHYCQNEASFSHAYRPDRFHLTEVLANVLKEYAGRYGIEKETQERIRRMVWVSLMECVKQEVRRIGEVPCKTVKKQIESYCSSELVKDAVNGLDAGKFGTAQRIFLWAVKGQRTEAVILLAWLRNRKGL